jgi:TRAP-type mannitol/chloroaromatic compound transport system substrate-binding protein
MHSARRDLLKAALVSGASAALGCSDESAAPERPKTSKKTVTWKIQSSWDAGTLGFNALRELCATIKRFTDGELVLDPVAAGAVAGIDELLDALKTGKLDALHSFPGYFVAKIPSCAFLSSYPLGMDRPDQWQTWFYELGGLDVARRAFAEKGAYFVGPIQHDINIIHSRVPIRSFDDLRDKTIRFPGGIIAEVFEAAGVKTVMAAGGDIYGKLERGELDAAEFVGPAGNYALGFAKVAKYIILGPPSTPSLHQPADLWALIVGMDKWNALPKHTQELVTVALREHSWMFYANVQKENLVAWEKYRAEGVSVLRLSEQDVAKLRRVAIPVWFKWAAKDALAREAFASQLAYMKSPNIAYLADDMLVDADGKKLTL